MSRVCLILFAVLLVCARAYKVAPQTFEPGVAASEGGSATLRYLFHGSSSSKRTWNVPQHAQVYQHRTRQKRQGAELYLTASYVIPGGEGSGPWGAWGEVSPCSRTCGGGVASQKRICLRSEDQSQCRGGDTKYFSCQTQDCPEGSGDFRAEQCAEFNDKLFEGYKYNWMPYTKAPNPCELICKPHGERLYFRHKLQVRDGTRCIDESFDVCVNGTCQPVGCDMMLNSPAREDKCRECRGNGANCRTTDGIVDSQDLVKGYNDILLIPAGSTSINFEEVEPSNNYLALRAKNGTYYLNGHYHINLPRTITIAGALWTYERSQQGFAAPDKLRCLGPTTEPLYLSLLFREKNVGIKYEYSVPNNTVAPPTDKRSNWVHEQFTPCSATCGGGFQTRNVTCRSREELEILEDSLCDEGLKPPTNQSCNPDPCPAQWVEGPWGNCSQSCGSGGVRSREVSCQKIIANGAKSIVPDKECFDLLGPKPEVFQKCKEDAPGPTWLVGRWRSCDKLRGEGKQTRLVVCYQENKGRPNELLDDANCTEKKPEEEQPCMVELCEVDWVTSSWSGCDTCTSKFRTRMVVCATENGPATNESFCRNSNRPVNHEKCNIDELPTCDVQWYTTDWSKCSVNCGEGVQTRKVYCGVYYDDASGGGVKMVEDAQCANLTKYKDTKPCTVPKEECSSQWFAGTWSECSEKGEQFRRVMCFRGSKKAADCDGTTVLNSVQPCNPSTYGPETSTGGELTETTENTTGASQVETSTLSTTNDGTITVSPGGENAWVIGELDRPFQVCCPAYGYPPPSMEWYRSREENTLLYNDTDYEPRGNVLLIRKLKMNHLGTYTCGANNGVSQPASWKVVVRAYNLVGQFTQNEFLVPRGTVAPSHGTQCITTAEATTTETSTWGELTETTENATEVEISTSSTTNEGTTVSSGGENAWVIGELDRPFQVCCPAYGYTPPSMEWYRSREGNTLLYNDTEYEPRGNVLLIRKLKMNHLGTYTCGANNGVGQPASWKVVVRAYNLVGQFTQNEFLVPRGTVAPSHGTQCITTAEATTTETSTGGAITETTEITTEATEVEISTSSTTKEGTTVSSGGENAWVIGELDRPFQVCCPAYGYPPPSMEWYRSREENTLLYNDTEYEPRGNVLLIRKLKMNHLGTYTCGANNGVGQPASWKVVVRAYNLVGQFTQNELLVPRGTVAPSLGTQCITTAETTTTETSTGGGLTGTTENTTGATKVEISTSSTTKEGTTVSSGGENAWVIGELDRPFQVCCPSYGYPPPSMEWYRSREENTLLYNDTEYEPRGNVLLIRKLKMNHLGTYTCGANNGVGQPASWKVVVRAYNLVGQFTQNEYLVPRGTVAPSHGTQCITTAETTTTETSTGGGLTETTEITTEATEVEISTSSTTKEGTTVSSVAGREDEGSTGPCSTSPYGCCQDDKTPAHGPDFEGCCLLQAFECCPDNRKPAEGPHLEGCGCQYALHGCCPDNVTIAQGPDNQGCGCQYTEYGCCPDRHTAASGPNNEGCACNTYQFSCCADGVTTAMGPEQKGCHCRYSKFMCCGDGETPATGPDGTGCDCSSNLHGCCPDGRTEATGPKFLGCTDVPENKQAACSMSTDHGPCINNLAMWYYDMAYGGCSRFWYGGCDGNGNRFSTKEECEDVCVQPSPKDACKLPSVKGACDADYQRWHYNSTLEQCIPFRYGGCLGNANNFDARELCQKQCEPSTVEGQCNLPIDQGLCAGNYSRWGFNSEAHRCEQFIWGGCEGNSNRFSSEAACRMRCADTQPPQCTQPQDAGKCTEKEALWSFSQSENRCLPFYYSGCGGNDNQFSSREACEQTCPSAYVADKCTLPAETGQCSNYRDRWFYDTTFKRCRQFDYGGCGGNENNFGTEAECDNSCSEIKTTTSTTTSTTITTTTASPVEPQPEPRPHVTDQRPAAPDRPEFCFNAIDAGPCNNTETRYAYDSELGRCVTFQYGGCSGNQNNFLDEDYCFYYCQPMQDVCQLPMLQGSCDDSLMRWFYDPTTDSCSQFTYGGCEGNDNRFESLETCENRCRTGPAPVAPTTPTTTVIVDGPPECIVPEALENCRYDGVVWFFDPSRHECVSHANQEAGPVCRHTGTFPSQEACERSCGVFRGVDQDQLLPQNCTRDRQQCEALECEYGEDRFTANGCQRCICRENPCVRANCKPNERCETFAVSVPASQEPVYSARCVAENKVYVDCDKYVANCSRLRCEYGVQRARLPDGCEKCSCVQVEIDCEPLRQECNQLKCNYEVERIMGTDGCERCECIEYPCKRKSCGAGNRCVVQQYVDDLKPETKFAAECRTIVKAGVCPMDETTTNEVSCRRECGDDADCRGVGKCCRRGCSDLCLVPVGQTSPHPLLTTAVAPNMSTEAPKVTTPEGGSPTLRCQFHGNPPPNITWTFGELTIDGTAGRYRRMSDGALEIHLFVIVPDKCTLPVVYGQCSNYTPRWFYNTTDRSCREFRYGGCGGNENNFDTEVECHNSCLEIKTTTTNTTTTTMASPVEPQPQRPAEPDQRPQSSGSVSSHEKLWPKWFPLAAPTASVASNDQPLEKK